MFASTLGCVAERALDRIIDNILKTIDDKKNNKAINKEIENFFEEKQNDYANTIIDTDWFADYCDNHAIFARIIDYYSFPKKNREKFFTEQIDKLNHNKALYDCELSPSERKFIKDFFWQIYSIVDEFYKKQSPPEYIYMNNKIELILSELTEREPNNITCMQEKYGLETYHNLIKERMTTPDDNKGFLDDCTSAISSCKTYELIDNIILISDVLFLDSFKDRDTNGLRNNLYNAFFNISRDHSSSVIKRLTKEIYRIEIKEEQKAFFNLLIYDITEYENAKNDSSWSIKKVKELIKLHRC